MKEKYLDVEWYEADFKDVASCECTRDIYTYVPDSDHRGYHQKLLSLELRARLVRELAAGARRACRGRHRHTGRAAPGADGGVACGRAGGA